MEPELRIPLSVEKKEISQKLIRKTPKTKTCEKKSRQHEEKQETRTYDEILCECYGINPLECKWWQISQPQYRESFLKLVEVRLEESGSKQNLKMIQRTEGCLGLPLSQENHEVRMSSKQENICFSFHGDWSKSDQIELAQVIKQTINQWAGGNFCFCRLSKYV
jgi:hypothetical protein